MSGKNASSADNPQERTETCGWILGFVDGEGSFLVNIFKSPSATMGWQVFPEFNVSQTKKGIDLLYELEKFFDCGHVYVHTTRNEQKSDKWDPLHKYCVRSRKELSEHIIPFFEKHPPRSEVKRNDFAAFKDVVKIIERGQHLTVDGMIEIAEKVRHMIHRKPFEETSAYKFLSSSETIRRDLAQKKAR